MTISVKKEASNENKRMHDKDKKKHKKHKKDHKKDKKGDPSYSSCPAESYQKIKSKYVKMAAKDPSAIKNYRKMLAESATRMSDDQVLSALSLMYLVKERPDLLTSCEERTIVEFASVKDSQGNEFTGVRTNMDQAEAQKLMALVDSYNVDGAEAKPIEAMPRRYADPQAGVDSFRALLNDIDRV